MASALSHTEFRVKSCLYSAVGVSYWLNYGGYRGVWERLCYVLGVCPGQGN